MKLSTDRILTTHVGSLIRPPELQEFLRAKQAGQPYDEAAYEHTLKDTVAQVVKEQAECRLDVISDGEYGKSFSWSQYVLDRLGGFERRPFKAGNTWARGADRSRFAEFYAELDAQERAATTVDSVVVGPITYTGQTLLQKDIDNFKSALARVKVTEGFLPVAAPASVIPDRKNEYYKNDDDVLAAIGAAMRDEYKQIIDNGLLVQLDDARAAVTLRPHGAPPAAACRSTASGSATPRRTSSIEAIEGPAARTADRYHAARCGELGRGRTPPTYRSRTIVNLNRSGLKVGSLSSSRGANPRHEHEWRVWADAKLPARTRR